MKNTWIISCLIFTVFTLVAWEVPDESPDVAEHVVKPSVQLAKFVRQKGTVLRAPKETDDSHLLNLTRPRFKRLRELLLVDADIDGSGLTAAAGLSIDKLYLTGTPVHDDAMEHVAAIKTITQLSLKDTNVTDVGVAKLAELPIRRIYLNGTAVTDESAKILSGFDLETLYIGDTAFTDKGFSHFKGKNIVALNVTNTDVSDASLPILLAMPLEKVYLKGSKLSESAVRALEAKGARTDY